MQIFGKSELHSNEPRQSNIWMSQSIVMEIQ